MCLDPREMCVVNTHREYYKLNPESNGLSEKAVSVAKCGLKKVLIKVFPENHLVSPLEVSKLMDQIILKFLFNYRHTPTAVNLKTPNELLQTSNLTASIVTQSHYGVQCVKFHFREG